MLCIFVDKGIVLI